MSLVTSNQSVQRLAAFEEFMVEYRKSLWLLYANPNVPASVKSDMDETVREVFYAGYAAGLGSNLIGGLFPKKTP